MWDEWTLGTMVSILTGLVLISAFFSASETGIMSINRYRLKHQAQTSRTAAHIHHVLQQPDRLLSVILIGNTSANILASALATAMALHHFENPWALTAVTLSLTLALLLFAEITPKTVAALYPDHMARLAIYPLLFLMTVLYPLVWFARLFAQGILGLFGIKTSAQKSNMLSAEELRSVVKNYAKDVRYWQILLRIFDLESVRVNDAMIPRSDIVGLDLQKPWADLLTCIHNTRHTVLPVYEGDINRCLGFCHMRDLMRWNHEAPLSLQILKKNIHLPLYAAEHTSLHNQLLTFQKERQHVALVVDEYGDVQGLITLNDLLEEIVGEFSSQEGNDLPLVQPQADGSYLIDANINLRDLNRTLNWHLPADQAKTLSGLLIHALELIPETPTGLWLHGHRAEVVRMDSNTVALAKLWPSEQPEKLED